MSQADGTFTYYNSQNNSMVFDSMSPSERLSAHGLILSVLKAECQDEQEGSVKTILCPNGRVISLHEAICVYEETIARIVDPSYGAI